MGCNKYGQRRTEGNWLWTSGSIFCRGYRKDLWQFCGCVISFENIKNQRTVNDTISIRRFYGNNHL